MKVSVVGLGNMGAAIAKRLLDTGHDLEVWNRTETVAAPFGERDDIGIVVEDDRRIGQLVEVRRQRHTVPTAHGRGVEAAAAISVDGAGQAHPDAVDLLVAVAGLVEHCVEPLDDVGHQVVGPQARFLVNVGRSQDVAGQVAHREPGAAAADGRRQHDAAVRLEGQECSRPATRRGREVAFDNQSLRDECGDASRHRSAGQAGELTDLGARDVATIPDQGIDIPGGRRH